jgi:small conductance mechanosensitive channel
MGKFDIQGVIRAFAEKGIDWIITSGLSILLILVIAYALARFYRVAVQRLRETITKSAEERLRIETPEEVRKRVLTLSGILEKTGVVVIWVIASMIILKQIGIDIGPVLAGAGIIGLAVGFGAQNLVRDVISGFFMLLENQVRVGDVAILNGTGGLVESINLRTTVLRDLSGVVHVFSNGTISTLSNMTKEWSAMVFDVGVAYKEDTDRVAEIMSAVAEELRADDNFRNLILGPIEIFGVDSFGDNAVVVKARLKTKPIQQWTVGREYRRRLKKAFDEKGIEIPFPHRTIYWGEASEAFKVLMENRPPPGPG